jgi:hypothetical protein
LGATLPVASWRATIRTAELAETANFTAALRREWPSLTCRTIRSRKSVERVFGIANHLLTEVNHDYLLNGIPDSQNLHAALGVSFQEVVHSVPTEKTEVVKASAILGRTE